MKVFALVPAGLVWCLLCTDASAQDRYRTGTPTLAEPRATLQAPVAGPASAPTYRTADNTRPSATVPAATRPIATPAATLAVPAARSSATLRTEAPLPAPSNEVGVQTPHVPLSLSSLNPTPEMWFYEQMRADYENPELQVRRNSEQYAAERKARIAAGNWYGVSNSRPMAYVTPHMYHYSPTFAPNARFPYLWGQMPASRVYLQSRRNYMGIETW